MYMLGFMVMSVIGAWVSWRHNPMYSLGRTIRGVLIFLLLIAAFIAAIQVAIHFTEGRSQTVQLTAIFAVTGLGTLGMIGTVIELSLPSVAALPEGTKLVRVHRGKVDVWAKRAGFTLLALGVVTMALPPTGKLIAGALGGFFLFLTIVMLFAGYLSARRMDQWLTEVELRPWVHWTYTTEQWKAWNALRVQETNAMPKQFQWKKSWWKLVLVFGGVGIAVILIDPGGWRFKSVYLGGLYALVAFFCWLSARSERTAGTRVGRALAKAAAEAFFGEEGMFVDGVFQPWVSAGVYLVTASQGEGAPEHLDFQFMRVGTGTSSMLVTQSVLVPSGAQADVAKLQSNLAAKCRQAALYLA